MADPLYRRVYFYIKKAIPIPRCWTPRYHLCMGCCVKRNYDNMYNMSFENPIGSTGEEGDIERIDRLRESVVLARNRYLERQRVQDEEPSVEHATSANEAHKDLMEVFEQYKNAGGLTDDLPKDFTIEKNN